MSCAIEVGITLTGVDAVPEHVTAMIGLSPTKTWRLGDPIQGTALRSKQDGWQYALPREETLDLEALLKRLLDRFEPYRVRLQEAASRMNLGVEVFSVVYMRGDAPASHISFGTLQRLVALGADLDLDLIQTV